MSLSTIRDLGTVDPLQPLGERKPRPEENQTRSSAGTPTGTKGVMQGPDGKLYTNLPEPKGMPQPLAPVAAAHVAYLSSLALRRGMTCQ